MHKWVLAASVLLSAGPALAKDQSNPTIGGGHMQHCPTAVDGVKSEFKDLKDGIEVTVTHDNAARQEEIRRRAKHVVEASKKDPTSVAHTGDGHGGGGLGRCEVVLKDTIIASEDVPGGARLTVKPARPVDLEWLKKETSARRIANTASRKK